MKLISQGKTLVLTEAEWVKCPYCKQKPEPKHFQIQYGANGSGKSTISRAFQTLTQEANSDISARVLDANENEIALSC